jgi:hypothetical protein
MLQHDVDNFRKVILNLFHDPTGQAQRKVYIMPDLRNGDLDDGVLKCFSMTWIILEKSS